ncbi:MAG: hypothetical protein ACYC8T_33575 [Myxococcaceae bacterium]
MKRKMLIVLLATGTVLGFGSGFAHLAHRGLGCHRGGFAHHGMAARAPCGGPAQAPPPAAPR